MTWWPVFKLGIILGSAGPSLAFLDASRYMWFDKPGFDWETSAQLIGCGRLGASVFGGGNEIITLTEDSIWDGPLQSRLPPDGPEAVPLIRESLLAGNITDGDNLSLREMLSPQTGERGFSYFGNLHLDFAHPDDLDNYVRALDTLQGNIDISYTYNGVNYTREYYANFPSNVITARITSSQEGALNLTAYITRTRYISSNEASTANGINSITMTGSSGQSSDEDPIMLTGQAQFVADGADITASGSNLTISGATTIEIYFDAETNYRYPTQDDWEGEMRKKLNTATKKGFQALKQEAVSDVQALIGQASIDLGKSPGGLAALPLDQRISEARSNLTDIELVTLTWNYGRHLLVAASRNTDGIIDMPPNLAGVWNNDTTAAWGGKFTININIEMNMWPADQTNLGEMAEPLYDLMGVAKPRGEQMARELYGCNGTVFHHNLDLWGDPAPTDNNTAAIWPNGAAWLSQAMIDHYRFNGDMEFLRNTAYPFLVDVAKFYQCYTFEWEGNMVTGPSVSPENNFLIPSNMSVAGQTAGIDIAIEMDNQLMRDAMNNVMEAAEALGIADDDEDVIAARKFLPLIREPHFGSYGQILEWRYEYGETDPGHRHLSPLYGLHPSNQFGPLVNETLFNASKILLDHRVASGSGSTGWSRTWLINQYARALSGSDAWTHVEKWFATFPTTALWNTDHGAGFQIDGNYGITSGLTEMMLQSQTGTVHILPALPVDAIPKGSFKGLMARGGFQVDAEWEDGKLISATVISKLGKPLKLRVQDGESISVDGSSYSDAIQTQKGQKYTVTLGY